MGRLQTFQYLTPEQNAIADACIRKYRFARLDVVKAELEESGILIGRSALHRYMKGLRMSDGFQMAQDDATVVTIVERATGRVTVLATAVEAEAIASFILKLKAKL